MALLPGIGFVPLALLKSLRTVGTFLATLVLILVAFSTGFMTIYGSTTQKMRGYTATILELWCSLLGNVDMDIFIGTRPVVGVILFFGFTFFTFFVFLTMLIAVITEGYGTAKEQVAAFEDAAEGTAGHHHPKSWKGVKNRTVAYFEHFTKDLGNDPSKPSALPRTLSRARTITVAAVIDRI